MADPKGPGPTIQSAAGFVRLANQLLEALALANMSGTQLKIMLCLIRLTYGWQRLTVRVSHAELASLCGLKLGGGFRKALGDLVDGGAVREVQGQIGRIPAAYMIVSDLGRYGTAPARSQSLFGRRPATVDRMPKAVDGASGYIYYAKDEGQVKIGFSVDPWSRIVDMRTARPTVELVAIEPGTRKTEADRHLRFAPFRVHERREWFAWSPEIERHVLGIPGASIESPALNEASTLLGVESANDPALIRAELAPSKGTQEAPKVPDTNELQGWKDIERQTEKERTTTTADDVVGAEKREPERTPSPESVYTLGITVAANRAIEQKWGEQIHPLYYGASSQLAADLMTEGIPLDVAQSSIIAQVKASKNPEPPSSINYFRRGILQAGQSDEQRRLDRSDIPVAEGVSARGGKPTSIAYVVAKTSDAEDFELAKHYAEERDRAAKVWTDDPTNAARLDSIIAEQTIRNAIIAGTRIGDKAIAADVRSAVGLASGFPTFDAWKAAREVPRGTVDNALGTVGK